MIGYDGLGRKLSLSDPDLGNWRYAVDPLGHTYQQIDAKRQVSSFGFDALGRLIQRTASGMTSNFTFDACSKAIGKLCSAS